MRRALSAVIVSSLILVVGLGCTKRVPMEDPAFGARKKVVVTFNDGTEIHGKIGIDETVTLITDGMVYRALVYDLTDDEIELDECQFIRKVGDHTAARERMESAVADLGHEVDEFILDRSEIQSVEQLQVDPLKTASRAAFWALSGAVSAFLLVEKS